jgi:hypothetical protein
VTVRHSRRFSMKATRPCAGRAADVCAETLSKCHPYTRHRPTRRLGVDANAEPAAGAWKLRDGTESISRNLPIRSTTLLGAFRTLRRYNCGPWLRLSFRILNVFWPDPNSLVQPIATVPCPLLPNRRRRKRLAKPAQQPSAALAPKRSRDAVGVGQTDLGPGAGCCGQCRPLTHKRQSSLDTPGSRRGQRVTVMITRK